MTKDLLPLLKSLESLADVPEDQLQWLLDKATCSSYPVGSPLFKKDDCIDKMHILLEGRFVLKVQQGNQFRTIGYFEQFEITGTLPYSRATTAIGEAIALEQAKVLSLPDSYFPEMIRDKHELTTALVHVMSSRIRKFTKLQQQNEKMLSLGKLSAGLAHELNNPSSAVIRSSGELKKHIALSTKTIEKLVGLNIDKQVLTEVNKMLETISELNKPALSMLELSELQDELADWLEDRELDETGEISEIFSEFQVDIDQLEKLESLLDEGELGIVLNWMAESMTTEKLIGEIGEASVRINDLVTSIKSYTHMDQAPERQKTNIHTGINNTLVMLKHKIKKNDIEVRTDFETTLPEVMVFVSETNQVWTNLIDNAIDAMENSDERVLTITTKSDNGFINVIVQDSGTGIPQEDLDKIFDPFYTTKGIGKGTGIGLDIVWQIVAQHNGTVEIESKPGNTRFIVCLPKE